MIKRILIFDNYDSFTQNLYNLLKSTRPSYKYFILRNNDERVLTSFFDALVISPGPMRPTDTGLLERLFVERIVPQKIPVFGVCLGMQFIAEFFKEEIVVSTSPMHGHAIELEHNGRDIFFHLPDTIKAARYNSLEVKQPLSSGLEITALEKVSGEIMALKHNDLPLVGVQFHPESFLTEYGHYMVDNFFKLYVEN